MGSLPPHVGTFLEAVGPELPRLAESIASPLLTCHNTGKVAGGFRSSCSLAFKGMEETPEGLAVAAATREAIKRKKLEQAQRVGDQTAGGSTWRVACSREGDGSVLLTKKRSGCYWELAWPVERPCCPRCPRSLSPPASVWRLAKPKRPASTRWRCRKVTTWKPVWQSWT